MYQWCAPAERAKLWLSLPLSVLSGFVVLYIWFAYSTLAGNLKAYIFKGTVRPDWICMRVVSLDRPWKEHQPPYVFVFLISLLNIWKDFKVLSHFIQKWIQPPACSDYGLYRILSSYWLVLLFDEKICKSVALFWFGLQNVRVSSNILLRSRNPETNCWLSSIFGDWFGGKDCGLWPYNKLGGLDAFLYEAAQNFQSFQKFKIKIKNL